MCDEIVDYFEIVIQRNEILKLVMTRKIVCDEKHHNKASNLSEEIDTT